MLRKLVIGLGLVVLGSTLLYARQGTVVTKDGHSYEGDVAEHGESVEISGVAGLPGPVKVNKANVATINYPDAVADEVHTALKKLDAKDVKTRIALAKAAMQAHAYEAARDALVEAAAIEPNNRDVSDLMVQVGHYLPTTKPTTAPTTAATNPDKQPVVAAVRRQVTAAEINVIRQCEWRGDDDPSVKIQIKPDVKTKFIASYPDVTKEDFNRMTVNQQAALILSKGTPAMTGGVTISTDPASVAEFKKSVNQTVLHSCGTNCHNATKGGSFTLAATLNNAGVYTNFLMLQQHAAGANGPLVDRVNPEASMLLQYMLPPDLTKTPHPPVSGFKPPVRTANDPRYQLVFHWIQSLNPIVPHYGIDLSREAPATGKTEGGK